MFSVKNMTAAETTNYRKASLSKSEIRDVYFAEYESLTGEQNFLNAIQNYPELKGQQTNLFKCFLPQAWNYGGQYGVSAFVHPEGVYNDPKGGELRDILYRKLKKHFQFENEHNLFEGTNDHGRMRFGLNVYRNGSKEISFDSINNLFEPYTIEECYTGDHNRSVPGIKDDNGNWSVEGHPDRIVHITKKELAVFSMLFDGSDEWRQSKLPVIHAKDLVSVLERFAAQDTTLGDIENRIAVTQMWDETNAQKNGIIARNVHFPESLVDTIYSGPHINVANPAFKASRAICKFNGDYDCIDLG